MAARPPFSCYTAPMAHTKIKGEDRKELARLWMQGETFLSLAKKYNVSKSTVGKVLDEFGITSEQKAQRMIHRGGESGRWNGGRMIDLNGYVKITVQPNFICYNNRDANNRVYEHRLVMAEHIGRPLFSHENVHHKNGDRQDNRIDNLELWSKMQPAGQSVQDKIDFAVEVLSIYRPSMLTNSI